MGYDDNADVATLIGYASRKLGRYDDAKYWYDRRSPRIQITP
jgi:hypothetical protein